MTDDLTLDLQLPVEEPKVRLSYSSLSLFETCGLQYKFRYLDKAPSRPSPILSFGNSLHEALRRWYNQPVPVPPPVEELLAMLDDVWDGTPFRNAAEERTYKKHAREVLTAFHKENAPRFRIPVALEQRFEIDVGGVRIAGVIDRMDRHPDGSYEIIDYKTNRRLPPLAKVQQDFQLSIYHLAAWEIWGIRPSKLTLYFLLPGQPLSSVRTPEDDKATRERILRTAAEIAAGKFEPRESGLCNWCDYQAMCPLFAHQFAREVAPDPDIDKIVAEWIERKRRTRTDYARLDELEQIIHSYCESQGVDRLFGDDGAITRFVQSHPTYDPQLVRDALPLELFQKVLRPDDAAITDLLAGSLPEEIRARLEEARIDRVTPSLRLREQRRR